MSSHTTPKSPPHPLILYVDGNNTPRNFGEASSISVQSIQVDNISGLTADVVNFQSQLNIGVISAQSYLGAPVGGVTRLVQLNDVNIPTFDSLDGYLLFVSSVGVSSTVIALPSSVFATGAGTVYFSALLDTPSVYNDGELIVYTANGTSSIASSVFALATTLNDYIPTSVSSNFAQTTSLNNYIPTSVSSTYMEKVGGTFTGPITGTSGIFNTLSATTYLNVSAGTIISATTTEIGGIMLNGDETYFLDGSGGWTKGVEFSSIMMTSGGAFTGPITGTSGFFTDISATTFHNVTGLGGGGSPSGPYSSIQFNNAGSFSGSNNLIWDSINNRLLADTISATTYLNVSAGTIASATITDIGGIRLNGNPDTFLDGSGTWVQGLDASSFMQISGGAFTGPISATAISATTYTNLPLATTANPGTIQTLNGASNYYLDGNGNWTVIPAGVGGGVSSFSALNDVFPYSGKGDYLVTVRTGVDGLTAIPSSTFATPGQLTLYIPTSVSSTFAQTTSLASYIPTSVSSSFALSSAVSSNYLLKTASSNFIPTSVSSTFAQTTSLNNYIPTSVSSTFAQTTALASYIPTSVSSTFAQTTSLNNYIPTSVSSNFALSSAVSSNYLLKTASSNFIPTSISSTFAQTTSLANYIPTSVSSTYMLKSGGTFTGSVTGTSGYFSTLSATNYLNVTATVGSATTTAIGGLQLNGLINTFYNGSGQWVSGINASDVMYTSGGTLTGPITGTTGVFNTLSATTYLNVSAGTITSATTTSIGGLKLNGSSNYFYDGSGGWTEGIPYSSIMLTSGGAFTGPITATTARGTSAIFDSISATTYFNVTGLGGGGSPSGPYSSIQFNNAGSFSGSDNLRWDSINNRLLATNISATTYSNVTATVGSATVTSIGGIQLNGNPDTFLDGSGTWVLGLDASAFMQVSGGAFTGNITGPYGIFTDVSAKTYHNLPAGVGGGASSFTDLDDVPGSYTSYANNLVFVNSSASGLTFAPSTLFAGSGSLSNYIPTSVSSSFAQATSLNNYIPTSVSSSFAQTTALAGYIPTSVSSSFAQATSLNNYVPTSVSSSFAQATSLNNYIPTSVSSSFAQTTSLNNYVPTSVSSSFAQTTALTAHTGSAVHWDLDTLNSNYVNTSGDTMTGTLNGVSAFFNTVSSTRSMGSSAIFTFISATTFSGITAGGNPGGNSSSVQFNNGGSFSGSDNFRWDSANNRLLATNISATSYQNVTATVGSASPTAIGGIQLYGPGGQDYFLDGSGIWVQGLDASSFLQTSGGTMTGPISGHSTSAFFKTISATNYLNVTAAASPGGPLSSVQLNNAGVLSGSDKFLWNDPSAALELSGGLVLRFNDITRGPAPASSTMMLADVHAGRTLVEFKNEYGRDFYIQPGIDRGWLRLTPATGTLLPVGIGVTPVTATPTTHLNATGLPINTYKLNAGRDTKLARMPHWTLQTTAPGIGFVRTTPQFCHMGSAAGEGGWYMDTTFTVSATVMSLSSQVFVGLTPTAVLSYPTLLSAYTNIIGFGYQSALTPLTGPHQTLKVWWNDSAGGTSSVDTGLSCAPSALLRCILFNPGNLSGFYWEVIELNTMRKAQGSVINDNNLPLNTTFFSFQITQCASASTRQLHMVNFYLEYPLLI